MNFDWKYKITINQASSDINVSHTDSKKNYVYNLNLSFVHDRLKKNIHIRKIVL